MASGGAKHVPGTGRTNPRSHGVRSRPAPFTELASALGSVKFRGLRERAAVAAAGAGTRTQPGRRFRNRGCLFLCPSLWWNGLSARASQALPGELCQSSPIDCKGINADARPHPENQADRELPGDDSARANRCQPL